MAEIKNGLLLNNNRVFLPSAEINIFPCSRRGQESLNTDFIKYYDPEARLNTERTNRLHTAVNGFKDSFIVNKTFNNSGTLIFVLAGYYIEIKDFNPTTVADTLGSDITTLNAYLGLHDHVSLGVEDYFTEMLYRQSDSTGDINYLDVDYNDGENHDDFFVGVSFTKEPVRGNDLVNYNLPLFSYDGEWKLVQTSLLPEIEHDTEPGSIKINGNFTVNHDTQTSFKVTEAETTLGKTVADSLIVGEKAEGDSYEKGTIKAKVSVEAPTLAATTKVNTPLLNVTNTDKTAQANIDNATITDTLKVDNITSASDSADSITIQKSLKVKDTIDVKTIINTADDAGVSIDDELEIAAGHSIAADALKVNAISSRQTDGNVTVQSPVTLNSKATLKNGLEVTAGDATIKSNLIVEDNINVGTPTTPATADNGGYIVAKIDITAEQDLIAKRDIKAEGSATVAKNLTVGTDNNTDTGTIVAKKLVQTPTLDVKTLKNTVDNTGVSINDDLIITGATEVTNAITAKKLTISNKDENGTEKGEIKTPQLRVNRITSDEGDITVDNKKLIVNKSLEMIAKAAATGPAEATIEKAVIGDLTVKKDTNLKDSTGTITAGTVNSDDLNQKVTNEANRLKNPNITTDYYEVPVIFVQPQKSSKTGTTRYQLQITRATILSEQQVD